MQTDLIIVSEYCRICHIEPSFLYLLQKGGLIEIDTVEGESMERACYSGSKKYTERR